MYIQVVQKIAQPSFSLCWC